MDKSELREKVIEAMAVAIAESFDGLVWDELPDQWRQPYRDAAKAVLDALHGIVRVNPPEATEEMCLIARVNVLTNARALFKCMSAAGDITQPKDTCDEKKKPRSLARPSRARRDRRSARPNMQLSAKPIAMRSIAAQ